MKQKLITITKVFMWAALAIIIGYDIVAVSLGGGEATISQIGGAGWAYHHSTIALVWGALTGHLFWITRGKIEWKWFRLIALVAVVGASVILDVVDFYDVIPILPALIGVPLGRLGWPQSWPSGHPLFIWKGDGS
jgi:hypothetical protein